MTILERERDKYIRMWTVPSYRTVSPGEDSVRIFLDNCAWQSGELLVDLGCGTGRAGAVLARFGLRVKLLDFCASGLEVDLPFIEANLWDLPPSLMPFDWVYCVDVLEHIPREYIGTTLDGIARIMCKGGYLQIACFEDSCGKLIGEKLHLTIQTPDWWRTQVAYRCAVLQDLSDCNYARFVVQPLRGPR